MPVAQESAVTPDGSSVFGRFPYRDGHARLDGAETVDIGVAGGTLRVLHLRPVAGDSPAGLPILFVPGWGGIPTAYESVFSGLDPHVELFYLETREKRSSRLDRHASFSLAQIARDVARAVHTLGLADEGYVLIGASFGGGVVAQALADRRVAPAHTILFDPMQKLWIPRWLLASAARLLSPRLAAVLRPGLKRLVLAGMREPTQRERTRRFIDDADLRKWKRASVQNRAWDLFSIAHRIDRPVYVVNGSTDRFHDGALYPRIAAAIADATLVAIPVDESQREYLIGAVASAYALDEGSVLDPFVRPRPIESK